MGINFGGFAALVAPKVLDITQVNMPMPWARGWCSGLLPFATPNIKSPALGLEVVHQQVDNLAKGKFKHSERAQS